MFLLRIIPFAFLICIASCYMKISASQNYYFPNQTLVINCTSSEIPVYRAFGISIDLFQVASIIYNSSLGICQRIFRGSEFVNCRNECNCTADGKSVSYLSYVDSEKSSLLFKCEGIGSPSMADTVEIKKAIPITNVNISPVKKNVSVMIGETQQFTCTTDAGRPAAWIKWYIRGQDVTNLATLVTSPDGTKCVSYSTLNYTGADADHDKEVYCEAINIEGSQKLTSEKIVLYLQLPITNVNINPFVDNTNIVSIGIGETLQFTCTTDAGRPAAWIQWYIREKNVTNQATFMTSPDGTKFVSHSTLNYTGIDADNNKEVYCKAINIEGIHKLTSTELVLSIQVSVSRVTIQPTGVNDRVYIETNTVLTFSCETDSSRPAALLQWIIGTKNVTKKVTTEIISNGTKFISHSTLNYTGNDSDHNNTIYCRAITIKQWLVNSKKKTIYIQFPVQKAQIMPVGHDNVISVVRGKIRTFICTTDPSRPAAWIQWYIGKHNLTTKALTVNNPDGTKFISNSTLNYKGNDADHDNVIYCEATNIEGSKKMTSVNKTINVIVPISSVSISPTFLNKSITVMSKTNFNFSCKTSTSRPSAGIQWYIGEKNVTNGATSIRTPDGTKFISSSNLNYTGEIADHNQTIHCEGVNLYGRTISQKESLFVLSSTKNDEAYDLQREVFIGTKEGLYLIVFLIANPMPKITWTFVSDQKPSENINITEFNKTSEDTFHHVTTYAKELAEQFDFGNYTMKAGNGIGPEFVHVFSVRPAQTPQLLGSSSAVIGGVAGSSAALTVVAVIGIIVFILRRKKNKGDERPDLHGLNGRPEEVDENVEDGLKDNPLYGASGMSVSAVEYPHVTKLTKGKNHSTAETRYKNPEKKKGKQTEKIELAFVYKNSDDLRKDKTDVNKDGPSTAVIASNDRKTKKNKDGLTYADLEFASPESGKKFEIRGLKNKTNYAMIDLAKKAEPLPPDSDDDDAINTGQNNIDNS